MFADNLYLDMNGIIHNCSLPNDTDAHFRLSEDKIFLAIFNYIDHLFLKIRPQKVFFMAVDGMFESFYEVFYLSVFFNMIESVLHKKKKIESATKLKAQLSPPKRP